MGDQVIDWLNNNLQWVFDAVEWPFDLAFDLSSSDDDLTVSVPKFVIIAGFGLFAYAGGGIRRAALVLGSLGLLACLGNQTWQQSIITMYALIVVLVVNAIIATMAFALAGALPQREKAAAARVIARVLAGWTWIHPFGLMLPAIFFFGIGHNSSVILATFSVLPITIAAAIATPGNGLDRVHRVRVGLRASVYPTVILFGFFAIMGMGGIGSWLFRSLSNQDPTLGTHATVAMWLVGFPLWLLLGPWSFDHIPGATAFQERRAKQAAAAVAAAPADITVDV